ncbi:ATP adenylyltransferase-domain-containing protein [Crepidotus variabilis]|uniref:ATP adenylyltransferase-domain-containing protein n=1 Tax=Crepidotus variabilis TaxID=179855 RepID=A0A9P6JQ51_9AGAR|nr:ATP adenylyltransferase-domain-containing protein [Crepidotus variabilis]
MQHSDIILKIPGQFEKAQQAGDLFFFPSTIETHSEGDIEYQVRLCPALLHKPTLPTPHFDAADVGVAAHGSRGKVFDPFAPPYNENLYVGELQDQETQEEFVVLLNKFSVVPHHFLLVTKEFRSQATPLMPAELVQAYLMLVAAHKAGKRFFSFYNCGDNSGASQAHKHIQFIPVEDNDGPPLERLARKARIEFEDRPFALSNLPYASHTARLPSDMSTLSAERMEATIASMFIQLLDLCISTVRHDPEYPSGSPSYNVILTLEHLHIVPRKRETYILNETGDTLNINSLGFAGLLLVKSENELEAVKREGVGKILRGVALESVHNKQCDSVFLDPV